MRTVKQKIVILFAAKLKRFREFLMFFQKSSNAHFTNTNRGVCERKSRNDQGALCVNFPDPVTFYSGFEKGVEWGDLRAEAQ
jgi:hypothetical protein